MRTVILTKEDKIAYVILNRPDRLNSIDMEMSVDLYDVLFEVENDPDIRVVVIKGSGRVFCAGGDIFAFNESDNMKKLVYDIVCYINSCILSIRRMDKVVIASVHGAVSGAGIGIMGACDIAIAASSTRFNLAYSRIGASPDALSSVIISRTLGLKRASYVIFTSEFFDAETAKNWGLVNFVVEDEELLDETHRIARSFLDIAPLSIRESKKLINKALFPDIESLLEAERISISTLAQSDDMHEGVRAFIEKRRPRFKGF